MLVVLVFSLVVPSSFAQGIESLNLPAPGTAVNLSAGFVPVLIKGMVISPKEPLRLDFIIDSGNTTFSADEIKQESQRLIKYFLAGLTLPKDEIWVNLSPYEKDRMIPESLGQTELGRDMLAQDYILKQLTASIIDPQKELGKEFWSKIRQKIVEKYGNKEIPVNTFNKVWIVPNKATVYESNNTAYVVDSHLKVMLDYDYRALEKNKSFQSPETGAANISTEIVREIVLPAIEKEVNEGKNFAQVRQIYHSLILAKWYKETIKKSLLSQVYINQRKISGVEVDDQTMKDQIYSRYVQAFKKGVFNFIKEDYNALTKEVMPRKYFSGGLDKFLEIPGFGVVRKGDAVQLAGVGQRYLEQVNLKPEDSAMLSGRRNTLLSFLMGTAACLGSCSTPNGFRNDVGALILSRSTSGVDPLKVSDLYDQIKQELTAYPLDYTDISILERLSVQPGQSIPTIVSAYKEIKRKFERRKYSNDSDIPSLIYAWVKSGKELREIIDEYFNIRTVLDSKYTRLVPIVQSRFKSQTSYVSGMASRVEYEVSDIPILVYVSTLIGLEQTVKAYEAVKAELDMNSGAAWLVYAFASNGGDVTKIIGDYKKLKSLQNEYGYDDSEILVLLQAVGQSKEGSNAIARSYSEINKRLDAQGYSDVKQGVAILTYALWTQPAESVLTIVDKYVQMRKELDRRYTRKSYDSQYDGSSKSNRIITSERVEYDRLVIPWLVLKMKPEETIMQVIERYEILKSEVGNNSRWGSVLLVQAAPSALPKAADQLADASKPKKVGGIDLNNIAIQHKGNGVDIQFTPENLKWITSPDIDGFTPIIIDINLLPSVLPLLGLDTRGVEKSS